MISPRLYDVVACPECRGALAPAGAGAACGSCGRTFDAGEGWLDLRPRDAFTEQTRYLDEALHADARHEAVAPPLLGSRVRLTMLRRFLRLGPGDRALDLGCGSGRTLVWNAGTGASVTGIDITAHFAREAAERVDLVRGDLRRLPLRDGAFTHAWSLDVLEHLSPPALAGMLAEANRVLADGGALFVYSHVRQNGWISGGVRLVNRLARLCERAGLLDLTQERLRKSDHVNPLADRADLERTLAAAGFRIERLTYYTPILGAFVENILVRIGERVLRRRAARRTGRGAGAPDTARAARAEARDRIGRRGPVYAALRALSAVMMLDVWLFGRLRSGPFFALARRIGPAAGR